MLRRTARQGSERGIIEWFTQREQDFNLGQSDAHLGQEARPPDGRAGTVVQSQDGGLRSLTLRVIQRKLLVYQGLRGKAFVSRPAGGLARRPAPPAGASPLRRQQAWATRLRRAHSQGPGQAHSPGTLSLARKGPRPAGCCHLPAWRVGFMFSVSPGGPPASVPRCGPWEGPGTEWEGEKAGRVEEEKPWQGLSGNPTVGIAGRGSARSALLVGV